MGLTVIIGKSKGHQICSLMQMTSLDILERLQILATFDWAIKTGETEVGEGGGDGPRRRRETRMLTVDRYIDK